MSIFSGRRTNTAAPFFYSGFRLTWRSSMQLFRRKPSAKVAIVMRTRGRALLLPRALESVLAQTFTDWHLTVVDDNPAPEVTAKIVDVYRDRLQSRITLLHRKRAGNQGLGYLLNEGILATESEFIAIHDDDDTWEPQFIERCLANIAENMALVTHSNLVTEYAEQSSVRIHSRTLYNPWQRHAISLFRLAEGVTFPAISFLFRRQVWQELGGFDEALPHKEDWEFSLRLFARHPIFLLEEPLANFHYRAGDYMKEIGNLVLDHGAHFAAETEVRNQFLRKDLSTGKAGLGFITNLSFSKGTLFKEILAVGSVLENVVMPQRKQKKNAPVLAKPKEIHVAFAADEKFAEPLAVALRSLTENQAPDTFVHIHIIDGGFAEKTKLRVLSSLPTEAKVKISWHECPAQKLNHLPLQKRLSPATYGRIFLPELLDETVEKIIYIDSDTLVLSDLQDLYSQDCGTHALLAVQDFLGWFGCPELGNTDLKSFGIPGTAKYFNGGVLLFNLAYWRKNKISEKILSFIENHPDALHLGDQNPLNICLYGKIGELDYGWNFQLPDRNVREGNWRFGTIKVPETTPKIIHFVAAEKPWLDGCTRPYTNLYKEYAQRTEWRRA